MSDTVTGESTERRIESPSNGDVPLSTAILEAIGDHKNEDLRVSDFVLYDDVDPDALDSLFRENSTAETLVQFTTDDVTVTLWGDGGVEIRVSDREE